MIMFMIMRMMMIMTSDGALRGGDGVSIQRVVDEDGSIEVAAIFNSGNFSFTFFVCAR